MEPITTLAKGFMEYGMYFFVAVLMIAVVKLYRDIIALNSKYQKRLEELIQLQEEALKKDSAQAVAMESILRNMLQAGKDNE